MVVKVSNEFSYVLFEEERNCRDETLTYCAQTLVVIWWQKLDLQFSILISVPGTFFYFVQRPTNAQLIGKLSHSSYMFRHYCVILRELVVSTLPSYTSMSNAIAGNTV